MSVECYLEALSEELAQLYFVKRDYATLYDFLAEKITWIGTGIHEICMSKGEAAVFFQEEGNVYEGSFVVEEPWFKAIQIQDNTAVVMATLNVRTQEDADCLIEMVLRFTVLWVMESGKWKVAHVHNSIPDSSLEKINYFNLEYAQGLYHTVRSRLKEAARTDALTGIQNNQGFCEKVKSLLRNYPTQKYALINFGIRDFRYINQMYGYSTGDEVLRSIAKNLRGSCSDKETCGRIEKDRFAMLYCCSNRPLLDKRMFEVRDILLDEELKDKIKTDIQFTAGIYVIHKACSSDVNDMLDKALLAQHSIRGKGQGSHFAYFQKHMMERNLRCSRLLDEAVDALKQDAFELYIQPQFRIEDCNVVSGEALTRWKNVSPEEFIPLLESNGMIIEFDFHMLKKVCKMIRNWYKQGKRILPISVNQSRLHMENKEYLTQFSRIVDMYEIPHSYITFELTESAFIEQSDKVMLFAEQLHAAGFRLAIDDFGTGYASLNLLNTILADDLKLDKSLLEGDRERTKIILKKTIEMAHSMHMTVICEGIETMQQLELLKDVGCDIGQGYLISRAISNEDFYTSYVRNYMMHQDT